MSNTPRTDAYCSDGAWERTSDLAEFAGRLEIELYKWHRIAGEQIERLTKLSDSLAFDANKLEREVERLRALLRDTLIGHPDNCPCRFCKVAFRAALGEE